MAGAAKHPAIGHYIRLGQNCQESLDVHKILDAPESGKLIVPSDDPANPGIPCYNSDQVWGFLRIASSHYQIRRYLQGCSRHAIMLADISPLF